MPVLRTGERKVVDHATAVPAQIVAHTIDSTFEYFSIGIPLPDGALPRIVNVRTPDRGAALAFTRGAEVWVRRPAKDAAQSLVGEAYFGDESPPDAATQITHFVVKPAEDRAPYPKVVRAFGQALAQSFRESSRASAFYAFAAARVEERYAPTPSVATGNARNRRSRNELERLMDTTTGLTSIEEAIQADRPLWLDGARTKPTISISTVKPPPLASHPFVAMLNALHKAVPEEKLASATPAEFYYARANDLNVLFKIVDQLDAWATPALNVLEGRGEDHALTARTLTQLGLERGPLSRALGTQVVGELALVGSDPYVREGSDVTLLFRVKQKSLFDMAVSGSLAAHLAAHGGGSDKVIDAGGTPIRVQTSTDGAVRQHRAGVGDLEIVSNSLAATRRVLLAIAGKAPRLSDEPDLRYMLARGGNATSDAVLFMGDRFVSEVIGPRQKILEARRILACAELLVPGYAALLYGWLEGRVPASTDELIAAGWLKREELNHVIDNSPIVFTPGAGARSSWGTPAALTPLYDLPSPTLVTETEKSAYARFAESYQRSWQQYVDPVLVRIKVETVGKDTRLIADVRVLPLIESSEYRELNELVGKARVVTPTLTSGLRTVFAIGADAKLRRELNHLMGSSPLAGRFVLDWLGDWLLFGVEDRPEIGAALLAIEPSAVPQAPGAEPRNRKFDAQLGAIARAPLYLAIGIRNMLGAAVFLTGARKLATEAAPGVVEWGEGAPYKTARVVHIAVAAKSIGQGTPSIGLYYTLFDGVFIISFSERTVQSLVDERLSKTGTDSAELAQKDATQFVLQWASGKGSPLNTTLGWLLESMGLKSVDQSRARAEALLRGAPGADLRTIGLAYEGAVPIPLDGGTYMLGPDGVRDPVRGSAIVEKWPSMPVAGSAVDKLLSAIMSFRGEVSFDDEPAVAGQPVMHSLSARVVLGTKP